MEPPAVDRPNPFVTNSELANEADGVVRAYVNATNVYANAYSARYADSSASDALMVGNTNSSAGPGRIEDLDSPTSPYNQVASPASTTDDASVDANNLYGNLDLVRMQQIQQQQQQPVARGVSSTR